MSEVWIFVFVLLFFGMFPLISKIHNDHEYRMAQLECERSSQKGGGDAL